MLKINPPIYLIGEKIYCWHCESRMPVVAILAPLIEDSFSQVCILSNITKLPVDVISYIQNRVPTFKLKFSKAVGQKYYANTCPKCGYISGDFFLHSEPGAPFFPNDEEDAKRIFMTEIPLAEPIEIEASAGCGQGDIILKNAKKIA